MKIYVDDGATQITIENDREGVDIHEMLEMFKQTALGLGYQIESWDSAIISAADQIEYGDTMDKFIQPDDDEKYCDCGCGLRWDELDGDYDDLPF